MPWSSKALTVLFLGIVATWPVPSPSAATGALFEIGSSPNTCQVPLGEPCADGAPGVRCQGGDPCSNATCASTLGAVCGSFFCQEQVLYRGQLIGKICEANFFNPGSCDYITDCSKGQAGIEGSAASTEGGLGSADNIPAPAPEPIAGGPSASPALAPMPTDSETSVLAPTAEQIPAKPFFVQTPAQSPAQDVAPVPAPVAGEVGPSSAIAMAPAPDSNLGSSGGAAAASVTSAPTPAPTPQLSQRTVVNIDFIQAAVFAVVLFTL